MESLQGHDDHDTSSGQQRDQGRRFDQLVQIDHLGESNGYLLERDAEARRREASDRLHLMNRAEPLIATELEQIAEVNNRIEQRRRSTRLDLACQFAFDVRSGERDEYRELLAVMSRRRTSTDIYFAADLIRRAFEHRHTNRG